MRHVILSLVLLGASSATQAKEDSASLLAQALEKIQSGQKDQAVKLLDRAFEASKDPEEVKTIAALIVDTSSFDYPKRESFLVYLTRHAREHSDKWKWLKEPGDRHFDRAQFDKAEDFYLQALPHTKDPILINLKLAFTIWNLKRKNEAFLYFLKLYQEPMTVETDREMLLAQVPASLGKLWWELGPLPQATWTKLINSPENLASVVMTELFKSFPATITPTPKEASLLKQIKDSSDSSQQWAEFLQREVFFQNSPCFYFESGLIEPDRTPKRMLIACVDSEKASDALILDSHFEAALNREAEENLLRAYLKYLSRKNRNLDAAQVSLNWSGLSQASKNFLSAAVDLLVSLPESDWKNLYASVDPQKFELLLANHKNQNLLEILQSLDSERWILFELDSYPSGKAPRAVLVKKALLTASKSNSDIDELKSEVSSLLSKPQNQQEKSAQRLLRELDSADDRKLPSELSEDFSKVMNRWIADLDRQLKMTSQLSSPWIQLLRPLVTHEIRRNVGALLEQIDSLQLPAEASGFEEDFYKKKEEMKVGLQKKYQEFLAAPENSGATP